FRLYIAMDNAFFVRELQRLANLRHDLHSVFCNELAATNELPQVDAINEFHQQIIQALFLTELMKDDNIWMIEFGERPGFPGEPFGERGILRGFRRQDLECYQPVELTLTGLVDSTHTPLA